MNTKLRRLTASLLVTTLTSAALPITAHADMLTDREKITVALDRADVAAQLATYGVTPADARARVAALTDDEAAQLAGRVDTLPAGGDPLSSLALLILIAPAIPIFVAVGLVAGAVALTVKGARKLIETARESRTEAKASAELSETSEQP